MFDNVQTIPKVDRKVDHWISDITGALCDPIIVFPGGWGDTLPDWIKSQITMERLIENMKSLKGEDMTGSDAEATAYLYTASLTHPPSHDWGVIYMYLVGQTMRRHNKDAELPEDIKVESLSPYQQQMLDRLKRWIYDSRLKHRKEKDRQQRQEVKATDAPAEQPQEIPLQPRIFGF